jgi:hypothetical protein
MKFSLAILLLIVIAGCGKDPVAPQFNSGNGPTGIAKLFDGEGNELPSEGILVTAKGTGKTSLTGKSGIFTFTNLPSGAYDLTFTKNGYGDTKIFSVNDSSTQIEAYLTTPSTELINFQVLRIYSMPNSEIPTYSIIAKVPGKKLEEWIEPRSIVLCISSDSIKLEHDPSSAPVAFQIITDPNLFPILGYDGSFSWESTVEFALRNNPFPHGAKVYATLCVSGKGANCQWLSNYYDPLLNKQIFTSLGPHVQVQSAIMP